MNHDLSTRPLRDAGTEPASAQRGQSGPRRLALAAAVSATLGSGLAHGVAMIGSDGGRTISSFATGQNFPAGNQPPQSGVDYETGPNRIRTEGDGGDQTFGGRSLTINGGGGNLVLQNLPGSTVTVDDLRFEDGSDLLFFQPNPGFVNLAGAITLTGLVDLDGNRAGLEIRIGADIGGTGGAEIVSTGSNGGVIEFSGTNTYDGDTTIASGAILRMGAQNAMPSDAADGDLIVEAGGTFRTNGNNTTIQGLSGSGTVENASATSARLTIQGDLDEVNDAFGGTIQDGGTGALSITKTGDTTTQEFAGANTYTGGSSIEGGTLKITNNDGLGTGDVAISGGTLELDPVTINNNLTFTGKADPDLTPHLLASDAGNIVNGDIALEDGGNTADNFNISAASGGSLTINGAITDSVIAATSDSLNFLGAGNITVAGEITLDDGTDAITKDGTGTLTLSGGASADTVEVADGLLNLAGALSTTGSVTVGVDGALTQTGANITASQSGGYDVDGIVSLNGDDATMTSLTGSGIVQNEDAGGGDNTLTIDTATDQTFAGTLRDGDGSAPDSTLALTKTGSGTQTLSGASSYTGGTSIEGGTLKVTSNTGLGDGDVSISGGTLELDPVTINNNLSFTGKADQTPHLLASDPGNIVDGNITLNDGGNTTDNFNISAASGGSLTINGAITDSVIAATNDALNFLGDGDITVAGAITLDDGTDAITKDGAGTLTLSGGASADTVEVADGLLNLAAALSTTGGVTVGVDGALIQTGSNISTSQSGGYDVEGTVSLNGSDATMTSLTGSGIVQNDDDAGDGTNTLTIDTDTSQSFTGTLRDGDGSGGDGTLALTKTGSGTQTLTGTNTFDGLTTVEDGALNIQNAAALGSTVGDTDVKESGRVGLQGGISVDEVFNLYATDTGSVQLANVADANSIDAAVNLVESDPTGGEQFRIESQSGTLNLNGGVTSSLSGGDEILNLGGAGNGTVESLSMTTANASGIVKDGAGNWTISNADIDNANEIVSQGGILTLADAASIDGDAIFKLAGGTLDVEDVTSGSSFDGGSNAFLIQSGQSLVGNGTVTGNIIAAQGATVAPGNSIDSMVFNGNLTINGTLQTEVSGSQIDFIDVNGTLDISSATLDLLVLATPFLDWLVLAEYDVLAGVEFDEILISDLWDYQIDYDYDDGTSTNNIAVYLTRSDVPAPAPLALIGLGILVWAGARGRTQGAKTA
jgi:fibronectin-binding autotransporter adhesin